MKANGIYLNANEGNAVVSIAYRDTDYSGMFKEHIGIDIDYGTHEDHLEISIDNSQVEGGYDAEDVGAIHSLLSKNGISVDTTGGHGISVSQNSDGAYTFTDIETSTLLFALETIDASRLWGLIGVSNLS